MHELLRWTKRRELAAALRKRGHKVSGETLNRWVRNNEEIPLPVQRDIRLLLGLDAEERPADVAGRVDAIWALLVAMAPASKVSPAVIARIEAAHRAAAGLAPGQPQSSARRQRATRRPPDK